MVNEKLEVREPRKDIYFTRKKYFVGTRNSTTRGTLSGASGKALVYFLDHPNTRMNGIQLREITGSRDPYQPLHKLRMDLKQSQNFTLDLRTRPLSAALEERVQTG